MILNIACSHRSSHVECNAEHCEYTLKMIEHCLATENDACLYELQYQVYSKTCSFNLISVLIMSDELYRLITYFT